MLIELFLDPIFIAINAFLGFIPEVPIPEAVSTGITYVFNLVGSVGFLLPLDTVANVLIIVLAVYGIKFLVSSTSYVARKVPTIS